MAKQSKLKFHTEQRKIKDLVPFDLNPRKMTDQERENLTASIEKFDLAEIPVINTDDTICAGHQRVGVLMILGRGEETIDVRVPNRAMTEEEFYEYNVRSNKNTGGWDWDMLAESEFNTKLEDWGFTKQEMNFIEGEKSFEEDSEETDPQKDQADTKVTVGGYRFILTREQFAEWEESIIQKIGFNRDDIMEEILKRLKIEV